MATPQTIAFHTLGCKLNFSETSTIRRNFEERGYSILKWTDAADIYLLNTCSVTEFADRKCRAEVRKILRINPDARVIVVGCYAQLKPNEIAAIPGVDLVLGAAEKFQVLNYVETLAKSTSKGMVRAGEIHEVNSFEQSFSFGDRTRTFLKIQDGCDYKCSFCTIPQARGKSRSSKIKHVLQEAHKIASLGAREIVLTGVNIGDFGKSNLTTPKENFLELIKRLDKVEGIDRIRISSIEPNLCSDDIIDFVAGSDRFVPHFHMPLQSGSDKILGKMKRRYRTTLYKERVKRIKRIMPHACIGVDVIVGFPGESEAEFMNTVGFINDLDVSYLHVFTYSERANTPASTMSDVVSVRERRRRNRVLQELSAKKKKAFYKKHKGQTRPVLIEQTKKEFGLCGFTDNYIKVYLTNTDQDLINTIQDVRLNELQTGTFYKGTLLNKRMVIA